MTGSALETSRVLGAVERYLPVIVILLAAVLLASDLNQGWVPHDEGALGQSAERVLAGQVPHRDFDEIYTGALAYLPAASFMIASHSSTTMRMPLFLFALLWVGAMYAIARRFTPPFGAALISITALVWSVPNYPASLPSWFNLFFATFGLLALLKGIESERRQWLLIAGMAGGVSFLFKLSGIFYLLGGGIALIATSFRRQPGEVPEAGRSRSGAVVVTAIPLLVMIALALPIGRAGVNEIVRFILPLALIVAALIGREWNHGSAPAGARLRALFETLGPFALGALLPVAAYAIFLVSVHALPQAIQGVLVQPFRRTASAMMHPPPPAALMFSLPVALLLMKWASGRAATALAIVGAVLLAVLVYVSGESVAAYGMAIMAAWGLPVLAAAGVAVDRSRQRIRRSIDRCRDRHHRNRVLDIADRVSVRGADLLALYDSARHARVGGCCPHGGAHAGLDASSGRRLSAGVRARARHARVGRVVWVAVHPDG